MFNKQQRRTVCYCFQIKNKNIATPVFQTEMDGHIPPGYFEQ